MHDLTVKILEILPHNSPALWHRTGPHICKKELHNIHCSNKMNFAELELQ